MQEFNTAILIVFPILSFLLGSIPFGIIITRLFCSVDVRKHGSGNIGATNVKRLAGTVPGLMTLTGDMLKGGIPVWISGYLVGSHSPWFELHASLTAFAAFLGHLYPVFTGFKNGGKGVATAAGCFLVLNPLSFFVSGMIFVLVTRLSNYVSAGSLCGAAVLPFSVYFISGSVLTAFYAFVISGFIFIRHRDNIKRIVTGTENRFK